MHNVMQKCADVWYPEVYRKKLVPNVKGSEWTKVHVSIGKAVVVEYTKELSDSKYETINLLLSDSQ